MIQCFFHHRLDRVLSTVTYTACEPRYQAKNMHTAVNRFISVYTHCYHTS